MPEYLENVQAKAMRLLKDKGVHGRHIFEDALNGEGPGNEKQTVMASGLFKYYKGTVANGDGGRNIYVYMGE